MLNSITEVLHNLINFMFLYNVKGTSHGLIVGVFLLSMQDAVSLYYPFIGKIKEYGFIAFGIIIFNIKEFTIKKHLDPYIEKQLKYTKELIQESNLSKEEEGMVWINTINSITKDLHLNTYNNQNNDSNSGINC